MYFYGSNVSDYADPTYNEVYENSIFLYNAVALVYPTRRMIII